jgi:hypothetical protein
MLTVLQASSRYNDAVRFASEQYENAKSQVSILASGTPKPAHQSLLSYFETAYSGSVNAASERLQAALQYTNSVKSYAAGPTQGYFESVSSIASSRLSAGLSQASAQFAQPTGGASRQYYEAVGLAHARYSEFVGAASSAVYGPQQGTVESLASVASASAASLAAGAQSVAANGQSVAASIASQVSSGVIGSETPWSESVASQASVNWDSLIARASDQVYGTYFGQLPRSSSARALRATSRVPWRTESRAKRSSSANLTLSCSKSMQENFANPSTGKPTPWAESLYSQAGAYGAQATVAAAQQYADVSALISELVIGREPAFTESIMNRFSSAYYTGVPAAVQSVQSYAEDSYDAATSYAGDSLDAASSLAADAYSSASSVVSSIFSARRAPSSMPLWTVHPSLFTVRPRVRPNRPASPSQVHIRRYSLRSASRSTAPSRFRIASLPRRRAHSRPSAKLSSALLPLETMLLPPQVAQVTSTRPSPRLPARMQTTRTLLPASRHPRSRPLPARPFTVPNRVRWSLLATGLRLQWKLPTPASARFTHRLPWALRVSPTL